MIVLTNDNRHYPCDECEYYAKYFNHLKRHELTQHKGPVVNVSDTNNDENHKKIEEAESTILVM
jgi:hypothetical protein